MLVEMASGAALASIHERIIPKLQKEGKIKDDIKSVVVMVCGGINITLKDLLRYKELLGIE